jgi:hypothetical protein
MVAAGSGRWSHVAADSHPASYAGRSRNLIMMRGKYEFSELQHLKAFFREARDLGYILKELEGIYIIAK